VSRAIDDSFIIDLDSGVVFHATNLVTCQLTPERLLALEHWGIIKLINSPITSAEPRFEGNNTGE
jgi:hypothetical protein